MRIRELQRHEWALFRELRLRALGDAPDAFARTLAETLAQPDSYWIQITQSVTEPGGQVMFIGEEEGRAVGLAFGLFDKERRKTGHVGGMWVEPAARGRGVGRALLDAAIAWARSRDLDRMELWVTEGNAPAERLYQRAGFSDTGRREPLPSNPSLRTTQMALTL